MPTARRRRPAGPPRECSAGLCRFCGAGVLWLPFTANCSQACYAKGLPCPPECRSGLYGSEGYCGKRDGPCGRERVRVALWTAGADGGEGEQLSGWTAKGDKVTGRRLAADAADLERREASIVLRHTCDPFEREAFRRKTAEGKGE